MLLNNFWRQRGSVDRDAGRVIERLRNLSSTSDAAARRCILGSDVKKSLF